MDKLIVFAVLGLGEGALIAAIGLGVVLTYRASGVVNFATGAMSMYTAYVYTYLRTSGQWFVPPLPNPLALVEGVAGWFGATVHLPRWPTHISLGGPMSFWPALLIALLTSALLGALFHLLVFRPLRDAPPLAKVVASVGLMLVLQATVVLRFSSNIGPNIHGVLPNHSFNLLGARVPWNRIWLAGLTVIAGVALWGLFRLTRFGLATRAASENEKGAILLGFSPDRQAGINWVLGSILAGVVGILLRGILPLEPTLLTLAIVPALAAALVGNFTSFGITVAAGLAIGMIRSLMIYFQTQSWFPTSHGSPIPGIAQSLPLVTIVAVMALKGRTLPTRGMVAAGRLPASPRPRHLRASTAVATTVAVVALLAMSYGWRGAIINSMIGAILALSLVVLTGFVGQISLAQMAPAGIAGFTLSRLAEGHGIPFPIAPILAALLATVVGLAAAIPALRVRGVNLAVVSFAAAVSVEQLVFNNPSISGSAAGAKVPPPSVAGIRFGPTSHFFIGDDKSPTAAFGLVTLVVLVLLGLGIANLRRGRTGRRMLAVRSNERAAAAAGVSVTGTKVLAFGISAFIAGIGGAMMSYQLGTVTSETFASLTSINLLAFAYLGGITTVGGAVIAGMLTTEGVLFYITQNYVHVPNEFLFLLGGVGLIVTAVLNPEGIAGAMRLTGQQLKGRLPRRSEHPARQAIAIQAATVPGGR